MSFWILKIGFIAILTLAFVTASWYIIHGDISFTADIGRDFHLLRELDEKKIVLIGPRSSTGLFHGPLWTYVNYPAYLLGQGNPVAVGWGWVALSILFVISCFFIAKDLFGKNAAYIFTLMSALYAAYHAHAMFNPHGAMFLIPLFFYLFIKYIRTAAVKFLILHVVIGALITQFQMALGIPLMVLSGIYIVYFCFKKRKLVHLASFIVLPILLSNFVLFDLRHNHLLLDKLSDFVSTKSEGQAFNYLPLIQDRVKLALTGVEIIRQDSVGYLNFIMLGFVFFMVYEQIKLRRNRDIYFAFLYFYFGFFVLSFINKGPILYFYFFPLFPLVFLIFSSLIESRYKKFFILVLLVVLALNIRTAASDIKLSNSIIGKDIYSWKFLNNISRKVFDETNGKFGYFVYSPDAFAYEAKYAMLYQNDQNGKRGEYFKKLPTTYIIAQPPPRNNPYMKSEWWVVNQVKITATPAARMLFTNGYEVKKYMLNSAQIVIPFDPSIDPGLNFR